MGWISLPSEIFFHGFRTAKCFQKSHGSTFPKMTFFVGTNALKLVCAITFEIVIIWKWNLERKLMLIKKHRDVIKTFNSVILSEWRPRNSWRIFWDFGSITAQDLILLENLRMKALSVHYKKIKTELHKLFSKPSLLLSRKLSIDLSSAWMGGQKNIVWSFCALRGRLWHVLSVSRGLLDSR